MTRLPCVRSASTQPERTDDMADIGIIFHLGRSIASDQAVELAQWLIAEGHSVRVPASAEGLDSRLAAHGVDEDGFGVGLDLVVTLGGDGSILRAISLIDHHDVPVLGVNYGQLGYLTAVEPQDAQRAVAEFLAGDHLIEERMMLSVRTGDREHHCLNELVVERTDASNSVRLQVFVNDDFFTTYAADGLIVATPTGSTAYAFSVRGPIVEATHRCLLLTPVSPHMLFDRSLILAPDTAIRLVVEGHRPVALSLDGRRLATLGEGDAIECTASPRIARLVLLRARSFHQVLKAKFGLNDR